MTGVRIHLSYCECHMSEKQKVFTLDMLNMDVENNRKMTFYVKKTVLNLLDVLRENRMN